MKKTPAQLDAEIAAALAGHDRRVSSQRFALDPVEGLHIPADSRSRLNRFWSAHPALRTGCLRKYGYDPIDEEQGYWRFGLAEPDHADLLRAVRRNDDVFSLALVKRWEAEELKHTKRAGGTRTRRPRHDHATKRIPEGVRTAIEENALEIIGGLYRHHGLHGGKEPCLTVGLITDHLRQARMPEDFRFTTKDRQRTWTRSVLESMRRRGQIGSSLGARVRCYEPAP